jgi:molybdate transport system regulatory protein
MRPRFEAIVADMARKPKQDNAAAADAGPEGAAEPTLFIRIKFGDRALIGPGKVRLLELIDELGSISAAGRAMGMSYRRAWTIIDGLNTAFVSPLVVKQTGGSGGGGAVLTELGRDIVARYRRVLAAATERAATDLQALSKYLL